MLRLGVVEEATAAACAMLRLGVVEEATDMNTRARIHWILGATAAAAAAMGPTMFLFACAGDKQTHVVAPELAGRTNMQAPSVPNTPSASNVSISEEVLRACNIPDADAYFAFDSSNLTSFDHHPLDALGACFTSGPMAGRKLSLIGHADPRGAAGYNATLGQSRADAVATYLADHGMTRANVTTSSRGALDATGSDETGWAHDRRVDVMLAK
jgi:peptidoglycan-associated lipoprotein